MTWARLDDRFHEHRKIKRVWRRCPAALGLHVMAITYCAGQRTNGEIDAEFVEEKMPKDRDRDQAISTLVDAGLWELADGGWLIHDFLDFNPSKEQLDEARTAKVEAGRKGGQAKWRKERITNAMRADVGDRLGVRNGERKQVSCHYCGTALLLDRTGKTVRLLDDRGRSTPEFDHVDSLHNGGPHTAGNLVPSCLTCNRKKGAGSSGPVAVASDPSTRPLAVARGLAEPSDAPVPSRPVLLPPDPPRGARQRDADRFEEEVRTYAAELLPDEEPVAALSAVRSALGTLRDRGLVLSADVVRSEAAFWLGKDETGLSEDARERLRQLGDRFSAFNRNAEAS